MDSKDSNASPPTHGIAAFVILLAIFFVTRSHNVVWGDAFSLSGDEFFSFINTRTYDYSLNSSYPVYFLVTAALVQLFGSGEFILRLFPYTMSLISFIVFFAYLFRTASVKVASIFSLLMIASSIHLYFSTMARFYGVAFLFVGTFLLVFCEAFQKRLPPSRVAFLSVVAVLGILAHTPSVIPIGSAISCLYLYRIFHRQLERRDYVLLLALVSVFLGIGYGYLIGMGEVDRLTFEPMRSLKAIQGAVFDVTLPLFFFAVTAGLYAVFKGKRADAFYYLGTIVICYVSYFAISLVYEQASRGQYVYNALILFFVLAAKGVCDVEEMFRDRAGRIFALVGLSGLLVVGNLPSLWDFYKDGDRYNYKAATAFVAARADESDVLFMRGIQGSGLSYASYYSTELRSRPFFLYRKMINDRSYNEVSEFIDFESRCNKSGGVWVVFKGELLGGQDAEWFFEVLKRVHTIGNSKRFDHHNRELVVFKSRLPRCESAE